MKSRTKSNWGAIAIALGAVFILSGAVARAVESGVAIGISASKASLGQNTGANIANPVATPQLSNSEERECHGHPRIITIDVPGSVFTNAIAINPAGTIIGFWRGTNGTIRGFIREPDGRFTAIDAPGAGSGPNFGTNPFSINPRGDIAGYYRDPSGVFHGFVRTHEGTFSSIDAPGAGTNGDSLQGTIAWDINPEGEVAGQYLDNANVSHAFVRHCHGVITTFDAPGAGVGPGQGTFTSAADGLNSEGALSGEYLDDLNVNHGYIRARDGRVTIVDVPGAGTGAFQGTNLAGINAVGTSVGEYQDDAGVYHGFVRNRHGRITAFDLEGAGMGVNQGTLPANINPDADTTGYYVDANLTSHGFLRYRDGRIETFDARGAGTGPNQGTFANFNNPTNAVVGFYIDVNNRFHGFLRTPPEH